jgi:hypothetical protein
VIEIRDGRDQKNSQIGNWDSLPGRTGVKLLDASPHVTFLRPGSRRLLGSRIPVSTGFG